MKIIINGIGGRMGGVVFSICREQCDIEAAAGVDAWNLPENMPIPTYKSLCDIKEEADCVVDFSHHTATAELLSYCVANSLSLVLATTGHDEHERELIKEASCRIPIFYSANMSIGVALLCRLAVTAARTMKNADIEIIEKHHNRKLDAPSGTALMLSNAIKTVRDKAYDLVGRSGHGKREKNEIGIHSVRMGNIIGEHEVIIGTDSETVTLKHEAHTRALFAEGAVAAAEFIIGKPAGLYDMNDMISEG